MVCEKCQKKLSTLATPEVKGIAGSNSNQITKRKIGENKLLTSKNRYTPYASTSKSKLINHSLIGTCLTCKSNVARPTAKYCQPCAYKKGLCSMCGKMVIDVTYSNQSSK